MSDTPGRAVMNYLWTNQEEKLRATGNNSGKLGENSGFFGDKIQSAGKIR